MHLRTLHWKNYYLSTVGLRKSSHGPEPHCARPMTSSKEQKVSPHTKNILR